MKVGIYYQTQYTYEAPVSFSPHLFRLLPKQGRRLRVLSFAFQTNADAAVRYSRDLFDNEIASCFYSEKSALFATNLQIELAIEPWNAFDFILATHALDLPFAYQPEEAHALAPYLSGEPGPLLPFWERPTAPQPTVSTLVDLNVKLHENLAYERRDEGAAYGPAETIQLGRGACRDFAVLLAAVARGLGLAARLASGYLCEFGDHGQKVAEGALHAWTEIYLPGAGWIGFDPTNGYLCNHHHITAAVGLSPGDITPVAGRYYHPTAVASTMSAALQIVHHEKSLHHGS